jgi:RND family efflux transporter MFP subunit
VKHIPVLVAAVVVMAGAALVYHSRMQTQAPPDTTPLAVQAVSVTPVRVAPMVDSIASYGNLVSRRSVNIAPDSSGQITQILFTDGQAVQPGDPLVKLDPAIAEAQLQASRAQAETDMQNLRRTQSLSRQGLDSTYSLEQAQSRASASAANVKINERKLAQLTLRAPFAGRLGSRQVDAGALVTPGQTIVRLEDTSELQIEFRMPSAVALNVRQGLPVHIQVPGAGTNQIVDGYLTFVDPIISTDTRSVLLRAEVRRTGDLRPGLFVRVSLDLGVHPHALVVPVDAVMLSLNGPYVFVVDGQDEVHEHPVTLGLSDGDTMELLSGVKAGEQVVTLGQFRLRDGDRVKIVPAPPPDEKSAT